MNINGNRDDKLLILELPDHAAEGDDVHKRVKRQLKDI